MNVRKRTKDNLQLDKGKILTCRIIGIIRVLVVHSELNPSLPIPCTHVLCHNDTLCPLCSLFLTLMGSGGKTFIVSMN